MLNLVWNIIEFIFEMLMRVIVYLVLITMQYITDEIQVLFYSDFTAMYHYFPVIKDTTQVIVITALTLVFMIFIWQVFRNFGAGVLGDCEEPIPLLLKTVLFTFLIFFSREICVMFMKVAGLISTMLWDVNLKWDFSFNSWNTDAMKNELDKVAQSFDYTTQDTLFTQTVASANLSSFLGSAWVQLIFTIILIAICWNFLKLILEIGERYIVMCLLFTLSPIAFATGASNSTNAIFKGWCRMFASSLFMMIMNTWCLLLAMSSLQNFVNHGASAVTFSYSKLNPDGTVVEVSNSMNGNMLVWAIMTLAFLKCAQQLDEYLNSMGLSTARTGRGLLEDAVMVSRTLTQSISGIKHMGQLGKIARNSAGAGAAAGVAAAKTGNTSSQSVKMNNALNGAKPSQNQLKTFNNNRNATANKVGLSDKNIAGTKFNSTDSQGRAFGIAPDGSKLTQLGGGAIMSEMKDGTRAVRSGNGDLSVAWGDKSPNAGMKEEYKGNVHTQTTGSRTTETSANGASVTTDNAAHTVKTATTDGKTHTDFMEGSSERAQGIASSDYDPLTETMTYTDVNGNVSAPVPCHVNGPDAEMNSAAAENARDSAYESLNIPPMDTMSTQNSPEAIEQRMSAVNSHRQEDAAAYGLSDEALSKVQFGESDENGIRHASSGVHDYSMDKDGVITSEHNGYKGVYNPETGDMTFTEPSGRETTYDSSGKVTVLDGDVRKDFNAQDGTVTDVEMIYNPEESYSDLAKAGMFSAAAMQNADFYYDNGFDGEVVNTDPAPVPQDFGEPYVETPPTTDGAESMTYYPDEPGDFDYSAPPTTNMEYPADEGYSYDDGHSSESNTYTENNYYSGNATPQQETTEYADYGDEDYYDDSFDSPYSSDSGKSTEASNSESNAQGDVNTESDSENNQ